MWGGVSKKSTLFHPGSCRVGGWSLESQRGPEFELKIHLYMKAFTLGTIHILRHHIFGIFGPPSPPKLRQHVFSTKNKQNLAFYEPPSPPTSADVIYEWSLT